MATTTHYGIATYSEEPPVLAQFPKRTARLLGAIHIICGILCITFNSLGLAVEAYLSILTHGMWCGTFFIITGSFGFGAAARKTKCLIVSFLMLSIISAPLALLVILCSTSGYTMDLKNCRWSNDPETGENICTVWPAPVAMNASLLVVSFVEAITAILSAVLCSLVYCCCGEEERVIPQAVIVTNWEAQQPITEGAIATNPSQNNVFGGKAPPTY